MVLLFRMIINYKNSLINVCIIQVYELNLSYQTKRNNIMNYQITNKVADFFKSKGYNVNLNNSKTSDYIVLTKDSDKYNFDFMVRFSDHDAMTQNSKCADLDFNLNTLLTKFGNIFESGLIADESGNYDYEVTEFNTQEERDLAFFNGVVAEINYKLEF